MSDVHVLDEAHGRAGAAEVAGQVEHGVLVHAAADDRVELHGPQADRLRRRDAVEHPLHGHPSVVHAHEGLVVERVEAHGHALEASIRKGLRHAREQ